MFLQHRDVENHKKPNGKTMDLMAQTLVKKKKTHLPRPMSWRMGLYLCKF